ncbi:hypothetical protein BS50DRAFT_354018 [Corynespora cassiicola Philippines]|uniref:Uncharacterized protein n=1 Tax=Corynespora cassiicola Philippines TaxID=1448308 RepID=A0A2T2NRI7_CORCC|nr:hypothetical protein BS50DRAFT_354018 [Corynespora cassiicola Philippines]
MPLTDPRFKVQRSEATLAQRLDCRAGYDIRGKRATRWSESWATPHGGRGSCRGSAIHRRAFPASFSNFGRDGRKIARIRARRIQDPGGRGVCMEGFERHDRGLEFRHEHISIKAAARMFVAGQTRSRVGVGGWCYSCEVPAGLASAFLELAACRPSRGTRIG